MSKLVTPFSRGLFISFEGPEGSGKSTQAALLAAHLASTGWEVVQTREPGGTALGERLREILKDPALNRVISDAAEAFLIQASRAQLVREVVIPAVERGAAVVCDRFSDSTIAYQGVARGLGVEAMEAITQFATAGVEPDITFLLDIPPEVGLARAAARESGRPAPKDRFEEQEIGFHREVMRGFLEQARRFPDRIKVVPADRPEREVHAAIREMLHEFAGIR